MKVRELRFASFRNLHTGEWRPDPGVNILCGDNAQGKTNLLEACWLFTGCRSFRGAKDREMVTFGKEEAKLSLDFTADGREQTADITVRGRRQVILNGVPEPSATKLCGVFCGVVFSPAHLSLVREGPEERRRFADAAYGQLRPGYAATLSEFNKILAQRNAFLRQVAERQAGYGDPLSAEESALLDVWDTSFAAASAKVTLARQAYMENLRPIAAGVYDGLSGGKEQLSLGWQTEVDPPETGENRTAAVARQWLARLQTARRADIMAGYTTAGPHREDLEILLDGKSTRNYGSQGQQRSAVLALKLAEATLLQQVTGEPPVAFLDDVMSELDVSRQDYILNHIRDWQVFITCCEPTPALRLNAGKVFKVEEGIIRNAEL